MAPHEVEACVINPWPDLDSLEAVCNLPVDHGQPIMAHRVHVTPIADCVHQALAVIPASNQQLSAECEAAMQQSKCLNEVRLRFSMDFPRAAHSGYRHRPDGPS
jgi:hypothetical protein